MDLKNLKTRIAALARAVPDIEAGGPERNVERLARITDSAEGPDRDFLVLFTVLAACETETDGDYAALLAALGAETIARAFPDGAPAQNTPEETRARARAHLYGRGRAQSAGPPARDTIGDLASRMLAEEGQAP
jgi:hypothetical protein